MSDSFSPEVAADFYRTVAKQTRENRAFRSKRAKSRLLKSRTEKDYPMTTGSEFFLAASDFPDFIAGKIMAKRTAAGMNTDVHELSLIITKPTWNVFMRSGILKKNYQCVDYSERASLFLLTDVNNDTQQYFTTQVGSSTATVTIFGSKEFINTVSKLFLDNFDPCNSNLEWIYSTDGSSVTVALRKDRNPVSEMYSFLKDESLEDYYDRFMRSNASILLLIGEPGTGKTSFIRGLLQHTNSNAIVTYDPAVLAKDYVFAQFIEGDSSVFIIEDADTLLRARSDGNDMMHKFLNVGDGLVTTNGKKMIFSTNLPSIRDVDQALIRPGRCFDVLNFGKLDTEQVNKLCDKLEIAPPVVSKVGYTLAEVFNTPMVISKKSTSKLGFLS